jgi:archaellum biogenesis protein FlaJ (TadC family)
MIEFFLAYSSILPLIGAVSASIFVISLASLPWLAAIIPEDYFLHDKRKPSLWLSNIQPAFRIFFILIKNLLGLILLAGGFLMLFIPGQGLLTIFMGLILIDYPKKYAFEKKLVKIPAVLNGLNWLRKKANKPPLKVSE